MKLPCRAKRRDAFDAERAASGRGLQVLFPNAHTFSATAAAAAEEECWEWQMSSISSCDLAVMTHARMLAHTRVPMRGGWSM